MQVSMGIFLINQTSPTAPNGWLLHPFSWVSRDIFCDEKWFVKTADCQGLAGDQPGLIKCGN